MALDREQLVATALELLAETGLDQLTLRLLAARLSIQAPSLYWHIKDRAMLISLMADALYAQALARVPESADWRSWLLRYGREFRAVLLAHRDSARLCAIASPSRTDPQRAADALAQPLIDAGLDRRSALSFQASVISLTLGWAIYEQSRSFHDYLAQMISFDESFEIGLRAMVEGFPQPTG